MAREEKLVCDICRKETTEIVEKLFRSSVGSTNGHKSTHRDYTHHLDVGVCCAPKIAKAFNWHKRMSAEQYARSRKRVAVKKKTQAKRAA